MEVRRGRLGQLLWLQMCHSACPCPGHAEARRGVRTHCGALRRRRGTQQSCPVLSATVEGHWGGCHQGTAPRGQARGPLQEGGAFPQEPLVPTPRRPLSHTQCLQPHDRVGPVWSQRLFQTKLSGSGQLLGPPFRCVVQTWDWERAQSLLPFNALFLERDGQSAREEEQVLHPSNAGSFLSPVRVCDRELSELLVPGADVPRGTHTLSHLPGLSEGLPALLSPFDLPFPGSDSQEWPKPALVTGWRGPNKGDLRRKKSQATVVRTGF